MTDSGERLTRRYRELAREEPPVALDDAILAAARRSVQSRPRRRWIGPVSIAAVLVLGLGIALRMQVEQPGIETSAPGSAASSEYPMPQAQEPAPAAPAEQQAPAQKKEEPAPRAQARRADKVLADRVAPAPAPAPAPAAAPAPATAPAPSPEPAPAAPPAAEMRAAAPATPAPPQPAAAMRLKREAASLAADSARQERMLESARDEREVELERIAKLRSEGRHEDADKALEEFRKRHAGYTIPPALWERVKPR